MAAKPRYEVVEHTADIRIRMRADTLESLFADAAYGMFDLITGAEAIRPAIPRQVSISANDYEELMVNWLTELLFIFETEKLVFSEFTIEEIDQAHIRATARGETFSPGRHEPNMDIKAVTYYGLHVVREDSAWTATVVFDI